MWKKSASGNPKPRVPEIEGDSNIRPLGLTQSRVQFARVSLALASFLLPLLLLISRDVVAQDKLVGSNVDVRTILNFKVSPTAVQNLLPPGWELNSPTSGPSEGANLQVTFVDQQEAENPTGSQLPPVRYVLFAVPVKRPGSEVSGLMLFAGLSPGGAGPYGTNLKATEHVERKIQYEQSASTVVESWEFQSEDGAAVSFQAQFERGTILRNRSETRTYSQVKSGFFRIYRYEQGVDVVRAAGDSTDRLQGLTFKAIGGKFGPLFDGSERLVSVVSVPWYSREIYLPVLQ
ncbi:hypothetical protein PQR37_37420 [Paraburkholderia nemoris]|uniref:hypothetical protein n=1 Tax=Paraburkholderia nemoris TaxID=2793076 RepID=UPI0038B9503E